MPHAIKLWLVIGAGSFAGGLLRFVLAGWVQARWPHAFPLGTLLVNLIGCLGIGLVYGWVEKGFFNPEQRLFLVTGLLGGFTTYSAFSMETINLLRSGQWLWAAAYVAASIVAGLLATLIGISISRLW